MLKRLGTLLRRTRQPSAPDAGVQLEEYDSHLPGTDRPARTPPAPNQGCHRREAPARGPRCSVSRPGPGRRQLGDPARSQDGRAFPTRTPAVRAGSVGRYAGRKGLPRNPGAEQCMATCSLCLRGSDAQRVLHFRKPPQLDSDGVPSTATMRSIVPAVGRGHARPVDAPIRFGLHPTCADSDWACHPDIPLQPLGRADLLPARTPVTRFHAPGRP